LIVMQTIMSPRNESKRKSRLLAFPPGSEDVICMFVWGS